MNYKLIKLAYKFQPWDYSFMFNIEREMLNKMLSFYMSKERHTVGAEEIVKDLKLALRLLVIIFDEEDIKWFEKDFNLPYYVNTRNAKRFISQDREKWDPYYKYDLRYRKAWYLYNKLRYYKALSWWD